MHSSDWWKEVVNMPRRGRIFAVCGSEGDDLTHYEYLATAA